MTADSPIIPSESAPQPVPGHPGWVWWPGVGGRLVYARRLKSSPPKVVRGHNMTVLLARVRAAEKGRTPG
jgi:hypothetical protein